MAIPTPVNGQITDAATQANVKVVGDAPAMAMGTIYQSLAHSTGILYENATSSQQQLAIAAHAATNQGVIQIYSVDTMSGAVAAANRYSYVGNNPLSFTDPTRLCFLGCFWNNSIFRSIMAIVAAVG